MPVEVNPSLTIPDDELQWRFSTSGGPGGQHANRSNTRVDLAWSVANSEVVTDEQRKRIVTRCGPVVKVTVDTARSQHRNREIATERLADKVRAAFITRKKRKPTKPSAGAKKRRLAEKRQRSERKAQRQRPSADD